MKEERELERHKKILEQIANAKSREELPKISYASIAQFLATNVYFEKRKLTTKDFAELADKIFTYNGLFDQEVIKTFGETIKKHYPNVTNEEIEQKYVEILKTGRIGNLLYEIGQKNLKLDEINKAENLAIHNIIMKKINSAFEIKDLPKVGLSELNKKLLRAVNDNDFIRNIKTSEINEITKNFLEQRSYLEIEDTVDRICSKYNNLSNEEKELMKEQIIGSFLQDETINYTIEEIKEKEKRTLFIYKNNHELTMEEIKDARRISQLPPNLTPSTLTGYLNSNTTIYTNDKRIKNEDLKRLTELLFDGYKWEDEVIINEVKNIASTKYPDKEDAFQLLYNKLSSLPKTYYIVEEVEESQKRQQEFIGNASSNVNVYFIPNKKSPIDGGRFYNCYINRVNNLNLEEILPLDLDSIVPPEMDIDAVEWYVQEKADPTFKTAGGIILNKDETIGNVNVFRPNDGKIGISPEEKEKLDKLEDLEKQIIEKEEKLIELESKLNEKERQSISIEEKMKKIVSNYEEKALELQVELLRNIQRLKNEIIPNEDTETKVKGRGIK